MVGAAHFKQINDGFGHAAGDAALPTSGARLTSWAGLRAAAGRLGGDEFAVILELVLLHGGVEKREHVAWPGSKAFRREPDPSRSHRAKGLYSMAASTTCSAVNSGSA
ncbi:diguanylate cyclase domain-containing protein [Streptomyces parvus]|uniref:diguanylate cyclase domain-containing protein n=1 Tax=Streptomyces parvus TaxID=66428 RepID=UPI003652A287